MIRRFRVFGKGEKKNLVKVLMNAHFFDFEKKSLMENSFYYSLGNGGKRILLDYQNDRLTCYGKMEFDKIAMFKKEYENTLARKLRVIYLD